MGKQVLLSLPQGSLRKGLAVASRILQEGEGSALELYRRSGRLCRAADLDDASQRWREDFRFKVKGGGGSGGKRRHRRPIRPQGPGGLDSPKGPHRLFPSSVQRAPPGADGGTFSSSPAVPAKPTRGSASAFPPTKSWKSRISRTPWPAPFPKGRNRPPSLDKRRGRGRFSVLFHWPARGLRPRADEGRKPPEEDPMAEAPFERLFSKAGSENGGEAMDERLFRSRHGDSMPTRVARLQLQSVHGKEEET